MDDRRDAVTTASVRIGSGTMQERAAGARYPRLFMPSGSTDSRPGYRRIIRNGTGIVVISALHGDLTPAELDAIAEYRLQQYVLSNMYDAATVERLGLLRDPGVETLADQDVHISVGDVEGRFLCYMCMQSPLVREEDVDVLDASLRLRDAPRPIFPCESEYGVAIYGQHPQLGPIQIDDVRELTRLVRNQAIRTPVDVFSVVEAVLAVARAMCAPHHHIEAIVGCASAEVRRALFRLGIPMIYAPEAPILGDNLGAELEGELLWTQQSHVPGRFWPFALASADVALDVTYFDRLDSALALPVPSIPTALAELQPTGVLRAPRLLVEPAQAGGVLWTDNPMYGRPPS